jgi:hypothetical protein
VKLIDADLLWAQTLVSPDHDDTTLRTADSKGARSRGPTKVPLREPAPSLGVIEVTNPETSLRSSAQSDGRSAVL